MFKKLKQKILSKYGTNMTPNRVKFTILGFVGISAAIYQYQCMMKVNREFSDNNKLCPRQRSALEKCKLRAKNTHRMTLKDVKAKFHRLELTDDDLADAMQYLKNVDCI